jgi:putative sigma-54 modulation protein
MRLTISGHHVDVTDGLRERISKKLRRLERHCDSIDHIEFVLVVERAMHKAEANLHLAGADFFASETHSGMYPAIDSVIDKLDRQVTEHKRKQRSHKKPEPELEPSLLSES